MWCGEKRALSEKRCLPASERASAVAPARSTSSPPPSRQQQHNTRHPSLRWIFCFLSFLRHRTGAHTGTF